MRLAPLFLVLALVGCKKNPPEVEEMAEATQPAPEKLTKPGSIDEAVAQMRKNFERVYFDTDSSTLGDGAKEALLANVKIMQAFPRITVEVQGHADERGTTDYNLALGERRAEAVTKFMLNSGVAKGRVQTVSYGEEAPAASGSDDIAWTKNRRAEFRVLTGGEGITGTTD